MKTEKTNYFYKPAMTINLMIKFVIFDIGGVLIRWSDDLVIREFAKKYKAGRRKIERCFFLYLSDAYANKINELEYLGRVAKCAGIKAKPKEMQLVWKSVFEKKSRMDAGVFNLIKTLHKNTYKIAIISNTSSNYRSQTYAKRIRKYTRLSVMSCDVGMIKPGRRIFVYTMKKLRARPQECIFVDDVRKNTAAAKRLGINGIHFRSAAQLRRDLKKLGVKLD